MTLKVTHLQTYLDCPVNTLTTTTFQLGIEPNWNYFGLEFGGLQNSKYDQFVKVWCDLETKNTYATSVADGLDTLLGDKIVWAEGQGPELFSWCGYEWCADGTCNLLEAGEQASQHWWEIDDLLFGAFEESYLGVVNSETHCVTDKDTAFKFYTNSSYCNPSSAFASFVEYWWGPLTPAEEVKYGLTTAELIEEQEAFEALLQNLH